jgi:hypothetical protein
MALIEKGLLPEYSSTLPGPSISLLSHALDNKWYKSGPRK